MGSNQQLRQNLNVQAMPLTGIDNIEHIGIGREARFDKTSTTVSNRMKMQETTEEPLKPLLAEDRSRFAIMPIQSADMLEMFQGNQWKFWTAERVNMYNKVNILLRHVISENVDATCPFSE